MRLRIVRSVLAVLAVAGLAACTPGPGGSSPSGSAPGSSTSSSPSSSHTGLLPDETESPSGKPTPSFSPTATSRGDAELSIIVKLSPTAAPESYTLVCTGGVPAAESHHPTAAAACAALKKNPALLTRTPRPSDQVCEQRYGGPQTAVITGAVDGVGVESSYKLTDGCEISAWASVADILGSSGAGA
ncbi:SSI family serine proteinase inhibitor [Arthrobacter sp. B2a2-09]|uniref:SSI family serine proteinase inhibitor n=1 Tax=Arthrobacter sp. B2a2-09 TaxID=2952822 RepID=UPI0022CD29A2|nr:SSI family serine proteinase inhibitor [Arthrobacter sp. B2a2-09]MCZ9883499.1 SSI family serine proteinase inhibitor [Arthrobacter sp. B2a2-09]